MKPRLIATAVLLAFVVVSITYFVVRETRHGAPPKDGTESSAPDIRQPASSADQAKGAPAVADGIIVYYFHATRRCARCIKFEEYTNEAITGGFADELKDGTIAWRVVNVDEPANEHYVRDYNLSTKSVILVAVKDGTEGHWENLPRIWELVGDKAAFIAYIRDEVQGFRGGR